MILSCNSCEKKFVVPDNAIGDLGRLVQCSSCGNKWKQFPINNTTKLKEKDAKIKLVPKIIKKTSKVKKQKVKRRTGPNLYSPEYLSQKHGIQIGGSPTVKKVISNHKTKINFGFYNYLVVSTISIILLLRILYFTQETVIQTVPITEIYINYLFETILNLKDIILNFTANY